MRTCSKCKTPKEEDEFYTSLCRLRCECKDCTKSAEKVKYHKNPEPKKVSTMLRYWKNPAPIRKENGKRAIKRYRVNSGKWNEECRIRNKIRRESDTAYKLTCCLRSRLSKALAGKGAKSARTVELLGCPVVWLEVHLESLFRPGMTLENHGSVWEVDHIKPCAKFDLADPEQQRICFHWTNLQPLLVEENRIKSDSYEAP